MPGTSQTGGDICERRRAEIAGQVVSGELSIQQACAQNQLSPELLLEWVAAFRQSSLTAFDEQVRRTLAEQGVDVSTLARAEFQGDLGEFTIADLIQTLTLGDRDGIITVSHEGNESRIWCAGGEIIDAESGRLSGAGAVYRMLTLERGRVRASFHRVQRERRVHASTMELLLDGARRGDECRVLRGRLGEGVYQATPRLEPVDASPTLSEAALLRQFRAARRVADVLAEGMSGDLEMLTDLERLVQRGWLTPVAADSAAPSAPAASSPPVVLSFARFPTQPATPRAHRRWALGAGLLALALLTLPRYLLASRAELTPPERALSPGGPRSGAQHALGQALLEGAPPAASGPEHEPLADRLALPPPAASLLQPRSRSTVARSAAATDPPLPARTGRARRRAPGGAASPATDAVVAGAPATAPAGALTPATDAMGTTPRIQLIEARRPQMQILE